MRYQIIQVPIEGALFYQVVDTANSDKLVIETVSWMRAVMVCTEYNDRNS